MLIFRLWIPTLIVRRPAVSLETPHASGRRVRALCNDRRYGGHGVAQGGDRHRDRYRDRDHRDYRYHHLFAGVAQGLSPKRMRELAPSGNMEVRTLRRPTSEERIQA